MTSVGAYLRELRERRGIPLGEIARTTRVAQRYLESLEADAFAQLPPPVFTRGYVRAYCQALGESPEEALACYDARPGGPPPPAPHPVTATPARTGRGETRTRGAMLASLILLVVLGMALFTVALVIQPRGAERAVTTPSPPAPVVTPEPATSQPAAPPTPAPAPAASPAPPAPARTAATEPRPTPSPTPAPVAPPAPPTAVGTPAAPPTPSQAVGTPPRPAAGPAPVSPPAAPPAQAPTPTTAPRPGPGAALVLEQGTPVAPASPVRAAPGGGQVVVPPTAAPPAAAPRPVATASLEAAAGGAVSPYRLVARTNEATWIRVRTEDGRSSEENVPAGEV